MRHSYHSLLLLLNCCLLLGTAPARAQFLWQRMVGTAGNDETAEYMVPVAGGYVTAGKSGNQTTFPNESLYLSKVNYAGDTLWTKRWNFRQVRVLYPRGLVVDTAGNLVVSPVTFPPGSSLPNQGLLVKPSPVGDTLWTRTVASSGANGSALTPAGHYVLAGGTNRGIIGRADQFLFAYRNWDRLLPTAPLT